MKRAGPRLVGAPGVGAAATSRRSARGGGDGLSS